ncbi:RNA polymerase II transcriptional coactivator KELP-like [Hibiscus syriacus]|uniref:RNA polymerase II transcriptional coactivator KELP-like n=1 Tax=Hibiscus syriacus TaxID=106335 RepID=A0A6A2WST7_HIBSY|nr:uncharacterized protein LOC120191908 [Hibiscus syriacus]KAE8658535.1 RNA polymerase II transcriptional coactivator KELP-like [Hibiscus syriacus]
MGNCSLKGAVDETNSIRVLTDAGQIIDFKGPKLAREITNGFPGYGICRRGQASTPLPEDERLVNGGFYYLLPLEKFQKNGDKEGVEKVEVDRVDRVEPPKMSSADFVENFSSGSSSSSSASALEVLSSEKNGVWKVKLVISSQQLEDILSQQVNTEALIEKMRMAAAANSAVVTPRRSKWFWVVSRKKPAVSSLFKVAVDKNKSP